MVWRTVQLCGTWVIIMAGKYALKTEMFQLSACGSKHGFLEWLVYCYSKFCVCHIASLSNWGKGEQGRQYFLFRFCHNYAQQPTLPPSKAHGFCPQGKECSLSHDLDVILDHEESQLQAKRKKRKRKRKRSTAGQSIAYSMYTAALHCMDRQIACVHVASVFRKL